MPPAAVHRNACSPAPSAPPTTCPALLRRRASLLEPPNVPRSTMPPDGVHRNACSSPLAVALPTTCPASLMSLASPKRPAERAEVGDGPPALRRAPYRAGQDP